MSDSIARGYCERLGFINHEKLILILFAKEWLDAYAKLSEHNFHCNHLKIHHLKNNPAPWNEPAL